MIENESKAEDGCEAEAYNAEPEKTHAVLVGINEYPHWDIDSLAGSVEEACRVAEWLLARGVPPDQIWLLLSPLNREELALRKVGNVSLADVRLNTPEAKHVRAALFDNLAECDDADLLFFGWFGHGAIRMNLDPTLFYADATAKFPDYCNIESLAQSLRSSTFRSFRFHIFIIDTCQDYVEYNVGLDEWLTPQTFPYKKPPVDDRRQVRVYSTFPGNVAEDHPSDSHASFCHRLLEALRSDSDGPWPPRMNEIADRLIKGCPPRNPPVVRYSGWLTGGYDHLQPTRLRGPVFAMGRIREVAAERVNGLVERLRVMAVLKDPVRRNAFLRHLPPRLAPTGNSDVFLSLVRAGLEQPGGLEALTERLHEFGPEDPALATLYEALDVVAPQAVPWKECGEIKQLLANEPLPMGYRPPAGRGTPRSSPDYRAAWNRPALFSQIDQLLDLTPADGQRHPLLDLVRVYLPGISDAAIRTRVEMWLARMHRLLGMSDPPQEEGLPSATGAATVAWLLVHLVRKGDVKDDLGNTLYEPQGWLVQGEGNAREETNVTSTTRAVAFDGLREVVEEMLAASYGLLDDRPDELTIAFFVTEEFLVGLEGEALSRMMVRFGRGLWKPLGVKHNVVLRSAERAFDRTMRLGWPEWKRRWAARPLPPDLISEAAVFSVREAEGNLVERLEKAETASVCLAPSFAANPGGESETLSELWGMLNAGIPIAAWYHRPESDPGLANDKLWELVIGKDLNRLPGHVRQTHIADWENAPSDRKRVGEPPETNSVVLLWDDPDLLPPTARRRGSYRQPGPAR